MNNLWRIRILTGFFFVLVVLFAATAHAFQASQIRISTDQWPDCSDMQRFSKDSARIMAAVSPEEEAIAVWRFIRMFTAYTDGQIPREPKLGDNYIDDPLKVLNVYGAHHCDGLSRILEASWRSMGMRAEKLYRSGHTQANLFWEDADGVTRGHLFDTSEGWFVYDRTGNHIASPDEIAVDYSLIYFPSRTQVPSRPNYWGMYNWIHAPHIRMSRYSNALDLREGESMTFYWGNLSMPYLDNFKARGKKDFEHGPYPVTYGNSLFRWKPVPSAQNRNTYPVVSPYIISGARVSILTGTGEEEIPGVGLSVDGGKNWESVPPEKTGSGHKVCFDLSKAQASPVGMYAYTLRLEPSSNGAGRPIQGVEIETTVQHNIFSLPQLLPGHNVVTVNGEFEKGSALELTWYWKNKKGSEHRERAVVHRLPSSFGIDIGAENLKIAILSRLEVRLVTGDQGSGPDVQTSSTTGMKRHFKQQDAFATTKFIGTKPPPQLKDLQFYLKDLKRGKKMVNALAGIMVLRDKVAWEAVRSLVYSSIKHPVKEMAVQALFLIDLDRAVPVLINLLEEDSGAEWKQDVFNAAVERQHRYNLAAMIGRIFAVNDIKDGVPCLINMLKDIIEKDDDSWPCHASIIKSLGMLGAREAGPAIRQFLDRNPDEVAVAIWALGKLMDYPSVEKIRTLFDSASYDMIRLNSAVALCRLKDTERIPEFTALLENPDENFRGYLAEAFGESGNPFFIPALEKMVRQERFLWVRSAGQKSIEKLYAEKQFIGCNKGLK